MHNRHPSQIIRWISEVLIGYNRLIELAPDLNITMKTWENKNSSIIMVSLIYQPWIWQVKSPSPSHRRSWVGTVGSQGGSPAPLGSRDKGQLLGGWPAPMNMDKRLNHHVNGHFKSFQTAYMICELFTKTGWWFEPLWNILGSWDYYSPYMEK